MEMSNYEEQTYFIDSEALSPQALEKKHQLEMNPSSRTNHMEYMEGMEVIDSNIKDKVQENMQSYDYSIYTKEDVCRALEHNK